ADSRRAEAAQVRRFEPIDEARDERLLRAHDGQRDVLVARELEEQLGAVGADRDIARFCFPSGAGITGCDQHLAHEGRLRRLPGERVLASSAAYHEYLHRLASPSG